MKQIVWLGDSKEALSEFPAGVKGDLGYRLYFLQAGELPLQSRPMKSIGSGVYELKEQDEKGWYRVIYTIEFKNKIYVLHCFKKQSAKTSKQDLALAKARFGQIGG